MPPLRDQAGLTAVPLDAAGSIGLTQFGTTRQNGSQSITLEGTIMPDVIITPAALPA
jgi:hypothetical protein